MHLEVLAIDPSLLDMALASLGIMPPLAYSIEDGAALIDINQDLRYRGGNGGLTYQAIKQAVVAAFQDPAASSVVLRLDSPGGTTRGLYPACAAMRAAADASGKPFLSYVVGDCCSAAYALAATTDRILIQDEDSQLGCLSTMTGRLSEVERDKMEGVSYTFYSPATQKLYGNPHVEPTQAEIDLMRSKADAGAVKLFAYISSRRPGLTPESLQALQAKVLSGSEAVAAGLADGIADSFIGALTMNEVAPTNEVPVTIEEIIAATKGLDAADKQKVLDALEPDEQPADDAQAKAQTPAPATTVTVSAQTPAQPSVQASMAADLATQLQALQAEKAELQAKLESSSKAELFAKHNVHAELKAVLETRSLADIEVLLGAMQPKPEISPAIGTVKATMGDPNTSKVTPTHKEPEDFQGARIREIFGLAQPEPESVGSNIQTFSRAQLARKGVK